MSVDIAGNPWKFAQDGSGSNPVGFKYFAPVDFRDLNITKVLNIGDRIYFTDWSGRTVVDFIAEEANDSYRFGRTGFVFGLKCVQFDSGEMLVAV